jgi:hypothetical protein
MRDGVSPFLTERARERAPKILEYAATPGVAMLISPHGDAVMTSGAVQDVDVESVARAAFAVGARRQLTSFRLQSGCVHVARLSGRWLLCVVAFVELTPGAALERLRKAANVFRLALVDGGAPHTSGDGGASGAPAQAFVTVAKKN